MTTYTAFERAFLIAAYKVTEETGDDFLQSDDVMLRTGIEGKSNWVSRAVRGLVQTGLATDMEFDANSANLAFELTASGVKEAESLLQQVQSDSIGSNVQSIDSFSWTGLPANYKLPWERRELLTSELAKVELQVDGLPLSNSAKGQVRALIVAAKSLSEAPDPPNDLIWEMVNRANSVAGIASLFVSIMALFV